MQPNGVRNVVRILHLSDFHFSERRAWDSDPVLDSLVNTVRELSQSDIPPDLLAITGDIAFSGQESEYELATEWLTARLIPALPTGLGANRVMIVPGNHDVDRGRVNVMITSTHAALLQSKSQDLIAQVLSDRSQRQSMIAPHSAYLDFVRHLGTPPVSVTDPWWYADMEIKGQRLRVAGFCSSWVSRSDTDRNELLIGRWQVNRLLHRMPNPDWVIALLHHPWPYFAEFDGQEVEDMLLDRCDVVLRGHLHQPRSRYTQTATGACIELSSGAAYAGSEYPNGFQLIELGGNADRTVTVHFWTWRQNSWVRDRNINPEDPGGVVAFRLDARHEYRDERGPDDVIAPWKSLDDALTNRILLQALESREFRKAEAIYVDLRFFVGKSVGGEALADRALLWREYEPQDTDVALTASEWRSLKHTAAGLRKFDVELLTEPTEEIERRFASTRVAYEARQAQLPGLLERIEECTARLETLNDELAEVTGRQGALEEALVALANMLTRPVDEGKADHEQRAEVEAAREALRGRGASRGLLASLENVCSRIRQEEERRAQLAQTRASVAGDAEPKYKARLAASRLACEHARGVNRLLAEVARFNEACPEAETLRRFLESTRAWLTTFGRAFSNLHILRALNADPSRQFRRDPARFGLKLPLERVFRTGLNILVMGEAGAGKTTSLQAFAARKLRERVEGEVTCIYMPLARQIMGDGGTRRSGAKDDLSRLLDVVENYLEAQGIEASQKAIRDWLSRPNTLICDGIDEVAAAMPWVVSGICQLKEKFPEAQVIVSSRPSSASMLEAWPFDVVSLLRFTPEQRNTFVSKWYGRRKKDVARRIQEHLAQNADLSEVTLNPLLVTVLCVIADRHQQLPETEVRLYDRRLQLFAGEYDQAKGTARVKAEREELLELARKLAYDLHVEGVRFASRRGLIRRAKKVLSRRGREERAERILKELIEPCEIIVPMTGRGELGFGHLRFQEHLAATELARNRGIAIPRLMGLEWWRGALRMFADIYEGDILHIVREVIQRDVLFSCETVILELLERRSMAERRASAKEILESVKRVSLDERLRGGQFVDMNFEMLDDEGVMNRELIRACQGWARAR